LIEITNTVEAEKLELPVEDETPSPILFINMLDTFV
jgi:hypothetical protein